MILYQWPIICWCTVHHYFKWLVLIGGLQICSTFSKQREGSVQASWNERNVLASWSRTCLGILKHGDQVPTKYLFVSTHCMYVDKVHAAICSRTISLAIATRWCCWHGKTEIFTSLDTGLTRNSLRPAHRVRCYPGPVLSGRTFLSRTGMVCTYEVWVIGGILGMSCPWLNFFCDVWK